MKKLAMGYIAHLLCSLTLLFVCCFYLSACAPTAFVAGVATGSAVGADKRSLQTIAYDQSIKKNILKAWHKDVAFKSSHLEVTSFNRVVLLTGQAPTLAIRHRAYQVAVRTPKVNKLYNRITVGPVKHLLTRSKDTWITTKVKSLLLKEAGLSSVHIKVVTENHVVYLMGILKPVQGRLAANVVRQVAGVKKVVKLFEYEKNHF